MICLKPNCLMLLYFPQQLYSKVTKASLLSKIKLHITQDKCTVHAQCVCLVVQLCPTLVTPQTVTFQAPVSMGFSRQAYWSGLPFPFPGDLPDPGIEPRSSALQAASLLTELQRKQSLSDEPQTRNCSISLDQVATISNEKKSHFSVLLHPHFDFNSLYNAVLSLSEH